MPCLSMPSKCLSVEHAMQRNWATVRVQWKAWDMKGWHERLLLQDMGTISTIDFRRQLAMTFIWKSKLRQDGHDYLRQP